jgi:phosphodiesterase/alkaline phosphatase D-like protein
MGIHRVASLTVLAVTFGFFSNVEAQVTHNSITVFWTTPGDDGTVGTASEFDLRYSTSPITATNFASATRWTAMPAPAAPGTRQNVTVTGLQPNTTYYFAIKTADEVPNWSGISNVFNRATLAAPDLTRPAAVVPLNVTGLTDTTATLGWSAVGDDSLTGTATSYDIRYSTSPITLQNWATATQATGEPTPAAAGTAQSYTVRGLSRQVTYYFAVRVTDDAGNVSTLSQVASATTPDSMSPSPVVDLGPSLVWISAPSVSYAQPARRSEPVDVPRP